MSFDMKVSWREPSTKRGVVMLVTGGIVLYQIVFGSGSNDVDALMARVDWWIGIAMTIVGMLGFLPDNPRTGKERTRESDQPHQNDQLPRIELVGRSDTTRVDHAPGGDSTVHSVGDGAVGRDPVADRMCDPLPPRRETEQNSGWNG